VSWRVTVACNRAQGEAIGEAADLFAEADNPPVLVADEPDPDRPDDWLIHAYFDHQPDDGEIAAISAMGNGDASTDSLGEEDWVTMSQAGLEPIRAGRFYVHTPTHGDAVPTDAIAFEVDAGLAFGTGQHATTAGCLSALDRLQSGGRHFDNIADIGTGTGLLAFAALALWPAARCIATDIDQIAIDVASENAVINKVPIGHGPGQLLLATADGMDSPMLHARAPFDLLIANILAGPLIDLATDFVRAVKPGATILLAGLLDSQAEAVASAYESLGCTLRDRGSGEWPTLVLTA
jgi:ribosomal protein L11 methyltransferase